MRKLIEKVYRYHKDKADILVTWDKDYPHEVFWEAEGEWCREDDRHE